MPTIELPDVDRNSYLGIFHGCRLYGLVGEWSGEEWVCKVHSSPDCIETFIWKAFASKPSKMKLFRWWITGKLRHLVRHEESPDEW